MNIKFDKKRILVTGGAGFIGNHLCDALLKLGHYVICLDNFSSGYLSNIEHLNENNDFEILEHNVIDPIMIPIDEIYNLACPASPLYYQKDPIGTLKTCIYGADNLLNLALNNKAKILQASTSEIYGDPNQHPQNEAYWGNVNPVGIRACYDEGKRAAETLFFDYQRVKGLEIRVARIFNTYGPKMHPNDGRVVSNFIMQALRNENLTIYGDGKQTRSFCYITDLVDGLIKLMESEAIITGPVNLGNPGEFTISQLAEKVIMLGDSKSIVEYLSLPDDDPTQRKPDINLAINQLHWEPKIVLDDGIKNTINYFKELILST